MRRPVVGFEDSIEGARETKKGIWRVSIWVRGAVAVRRADILVRSSVAERKADEIIRGNGMDRTPRTMIDVGNALGW